MFLNTISKFILVTSLPFISNTSFALSINKKLAFKDPKSGQEVYVFTLKNNSGMTAKITNYRGIIMSLIVPDKKSHPVDVVLGYDSVQSYFDDKDTFFGSIVGRYANRIAKGQITIDGVNYQLPKNNNGNSLHSGLDGFNNAVWNAKTKKESDKVQLILTYTSPSVLKNKLDSQGFPGNLENTIVYTLDEKKNQLSIDYTAHSDADTYINLTNHTYFNLNGEGQKDILNHDLQINSNKVTPTDASQIPTGEYADVTHTPFDFRTAKQVGKHINDKNNEQIKFGNGYDHNWVLDKKESHDLAVAAKIESPTTGIALTVLTTQPGLQFYSGNSLNQKIVGKNGHVYDQRTGFALETQHFPDSPHHTNFPSTLLKKGEKYHEVSIFKFDIRK